MKDLSRIIKLVHYQLLLQALLAGILLAGAWVLVASAFTDSVPVLVSFAGFGFLLGSYLRHLFRDNKSQALSIIHQKISDTEYSLPLLEKKDLNLAEQLQLERLVDQNREIQVPVVVHYKLLPYVGLLLLTLVFRMSFTLITQENPEKKKEPVAIKNNEVPIIKAPDFRSARVLIQPPGYSGLPDRTSSDLHIAALSGSGLTWLVTFDTSRDLVVKLVNSRGEEAAFTTKNDSFEYRDRLLSSGLYSIKAYWSGLQGTDSLVYQSEFFRLEAQPDLSPRIEPEAKDLYSYHYIRDKKTVTVSARITDDFRVRQSFIVATVARGSGENVKFREVRFPLSPVNFREARLSKTIDLKAVDFAPGDELYYYWAAIDNKEPEGNFTKSDTYFIVYKDTTQMEELELATMAVNVMPEYFRSQRQIIIDTEKLLARRKKLTREQFNSATDEIGFDQKVLRLRYGQYLGEEFETSIGGSGGPEAEDDGDPLEEFRHAHDTGEGDHSAPAAEPPGHHHAHTSHPDNQKDPLAALMEQYVHAHDNGELNTYYEQSTRSLLKMALEQMWQSELHLRLYEPEKALPFEHKALELLKSAQQKARTYVKKSGYDPPPIKEKEVRLTGEFKKINPSFEQEREYKDEQLARMAGEVLGYVTKVTADTPSHVLTPAQKQKVLRLGQLLSDRILSGGLRGWSLLAGLQKLSAGKELTGSELQQLKSGLYSLTGPLSPSPPSYSSERKLERAFWNHLK